jgi:nucleoside-diphosphate-sugar epimerase
MLPETLVDAVKEASIVIHAAGLTRARRAREYYAVNHLGTRNILEACASHNPAIEKFILISSLAAAGPGTGEVGQVGTPLAPSLITAGASSLPKTKPRIQR